MYRYEIDWISDDTGEQETDKGLVAKDNYADAVNRITKDYESPHSRILEIRIYEIGSLLNDSEIEWLIAKSS